MAHVEQESEAAVERGVRMYDVASALASAVDMAYTLKLSEELTHEFVSKMRDHLVVDTARTERLAHHMGNAASSLRDMTDAAEPKRWDTILDEVFAHEGSVDTKVERQRRPATKPTAVMAGAQLNFGDYEPGHPDAWRSDALCAQVDPEVFFPDRGGSTRSAKKICNDCEVREQCLNYALENVERVGVWGGKSERERRAILRERGIEIEEDESVA